MKIAILMSTYNGEKYLAEQIKSIQMQTVRDWTLLIRDDGSSDRTQEIIREFVRQDARIQWVNPTDTVNLGVIKSFHTLLQYQEADYYFFADQDDVWLSDKIERSLQEATTHSSEVPLMVYLDLTVVNEKLEVIAPSMIKSQSGHANTQLLQELTENTVTGGVAMINHALARLWTQTDGILMHDWFLALLATAFGKLVFIDHPGELYRQHAANVLGARTLSKRIRKWLRPHRLVDTYWKLITASQKQAAHLLSMPLASEKRELVEAFVTILEKKPLDRYRLLKRYGLRKNKAFHTIVFTILIVTKFAYKE